MLASLGILLHATRPPTGLLGPQGGRQGPRAGLRWARGLSAPLGLAQYPHDDCERNVPCRQELGCLACTGRLEHGDSQFHHVVHGQVRTAIGRRGGLPALPRLFTCEQPERDCGQYWPAFRLAGNGAEGPEYFRRRASSRREFALPDGLDGRQGGPWQGRGYICRNARIWPWRPAKRPGARIILRPGEGRDRGAVARRQ